MINFKITTLDSGFLTIEKPSGKSISLKLGETVKADVMEILPSGGITLKIKGDFITAKTQVPLEKGATAFFKVTAQPSDGGDLKLQFMGYADEPSGQQLPADLKAESLDKLIKELNFLKAQAGSGEGAPAEKLSQERIQNLIKALPADIGSLPKDIKIQLQNILTSSLKSAGQSIQARLNDILERLPDNLKNHPLAESLKKDLAVNIEKLLGASLKNALQNTGVVFEAKLRYIAAGELARGMQMAGEDSAAASDKQGTGGSETKLKLEAAAGILQEIKEGAVQPESKLKSDAEVKLQQTEKMPDKSESAKTLLKQDASALQADKSHSELASIKNDLKAALLELKRFVSEGGKNIPDSFSSKESAVSRQAIADNIPLRNLQGAFDGLLKDIETFQALSKTTESFYTFLPVGWKELKDGEISFKRGAGNSDGKSLYSCRINLDLEEFGTLSVMIVMLNKEFFVTFKADKPDFKSALNSGFDELKDSFTEKGLILKAVNTVDREDSTFEQLEKLDSSERIINITV